MTPDRSESRDVMLAEAGTLYRDRRYAALIERFGAWPAADLLVEPSLAFWVADAMLRVGKATTGLDIVRDLLVRLEFSTDTHLRLNALNLFGMLLFETGSVQLAESVWLELLEAAVDAEDQNFIARANNNLGIIYTVHGRDAEAIVTYERALAAYQRLGYRRGLAQAHHNLATTFREMRRFTDADAHFRAAIDYATSDGSEDEIARAELERSLSILHSSSDERFPESIALRAKARFEQRHDAAGVADAHRVLAMIAYARGDYADTCRMVDQALKLAAEIPAPLIEAEALEILAAVLDNTERAAAAAELKQRSAEIFASLGLQQWGMRQRENIGRLQNRARA